MDFAIVMSNGQAEMTYGKATDLFNNVYLSLMIRRGSFFAAPDLGSRLHLLKKNTARSEALAEDYAREALQWMIDLGRLTTVVIAAERDRLQDLHKLKLLVQVTEANGREVTFTYFVEVV